ncbi:MAG TPA: ABC transporter ATP-binding protein [Flexivirga sp.]|uniref:ABC transporter ATP-binding protein n=1 Tax=Flexivirga sp. TaxID=1962927 RepID=UPI002D12929E|nr:ABC transporter ATP-binding protein [Flexivirga sp.]HWC22618.1 ABC transporter ATP-binding protein [Flexivirga sp.]
MTTTASRAADGTVTQPSATPPQDHRRQLGWRRLAGIPTTFTLAVLAIGTIAQTMGTVVAGRLAAHPTSTLVILLALCVVGGAVLDTVGRYFWASIIDRAEGALRADLLDAALHQPLSALSEQAVGEVLDRVDDDTHEVGTLLRQQVWRLLQTLVALVPMWLIAGFTWWPAWLLFPAIASVTFLVIKPKLGELARRKVAEEISWTDHAAALEESIAGADDLRTSFGQPFAIARLARLSATIHERFKSVLDLEWMLTLRASVLLHGLLAAVGLVGIALVSSGGMSIAAVVTLFLVTTTFVGQIDMTARHLPDLQTGIGALIRLRQMLSVEPEPVGGAALPQKSLDIRLENLEFSYDEGSFALRELSLTVPAGHTVALVGRTGSGKSTLASLLSRAVEPPPGMVFLGDADVTTLDLAQLRSSVGVVTQRTELLVGTLAENIALFADIPRETIVAAVDRLGLTDWVEGLPDGLDTVLGASGTSLSAGEEQLVAFARLLVRDVRVVVLDEATARMDPLTERRVVSAAEHLLAGRTGVLVAHRLSTIARADQVAVLDRGRLVQSGPRETLATVEGPFRSLLEASAAHEVEEHEQELAEQHAHGEQVGGRRRTGPAPEIDDPGHGPSLARGIAHALRITPRWGATAIGLFLGSALLGSLGAITGLVWGNAVEDLKAGHTPTTLGVLLVLSLLAGPVMLSEAIRRYPRWWVEVLLRTRMSVLIGQTRGHRLAKTPPGEVMGRALDSDRFAMYADRWVDFINGLLIAAVTAIISGTVLAGLVLLGVMVGAAVASSAGRPIAGRSAAKASESRANFGRALVSALESARTVKLASRTPEVHQHLQRVDGGRVDAAISEHRVRAILDGVPIILVQVGVVVAWAAFLEGVWGLATAILVANAVSGFDWFGRVAGSVVTEAPGARAWQKATSRFAGGVDLVSLSPDINLLEGTAPAPPKVARNPLQELTIRDFSAIHDDGTIGVADVDLTVRRGEFVLLLGQIGSGKSSLLSSLAGLLSHSGSLQWNHEEVADAQAFMRPAQIAHVAQVPRVLSGTFADNVQLGHDRPFEEPVATARLTPDVDAAGGADSVIGHRGVRLSGGQVQRLALARALATESELLLADDVSSALDASTEIELWAALRERHTTVIGATSKRAALAQADRVVVLVDGTVTAIGPWSQLRTQWDHLAG